MRDAEYVKQLLRHLTTYRERTLGVPAGTWGRPPREYGHILPREHLRLNIVEPIRDSFWRTQSVRSWTLHQYFHHLSSSQALAFNLFFPLYPEVPPTFAATRALLGLRSEAPARLEFEVVLPSGDGTNIDVLITEANGRRTVIEIKLTEATFGRARHDVRHLQKLKQVYQPLLYDRLGDSALQPGDFFRDYQLLRNLAQLRPGSDDCVLLLFPRARLELWRFASDWCLRAELGALSGKAVPVAIEDLVAAMQLDAGHAQTDPRPFQAVASKYLTHFD